MSALDTRNTPKEMISQSDLNFVNLSSKTYVFEDQMTKYWSV